MTAVSLMSSLTHQVMYAYLMNVLYISDSGHTAHTYPGSTSPQHAAAQSHTHMIQDSMV